MNFTIRQAKDTILCNLDGFEANSQNLLNMAAKSLDRCGDDSSPVSSRLNNLLDNYSVLDHYFDNERWAEDVYIAVVAMKRRDLCKQAIKQNGGKVDGETAQWITTAVQGVFGVASVVFTILFALGIIPKDLFGVLGENSDAFYYLIGTICQQVVTFVIVIGIGIWNHCVIRKKYAKRDVTFEELMSVKYDGKPAGFFLRPFTKITHLVINFFHIGSTTVIGEQYNINDTSAATKSSNANDKEDK